MKQADATNQPQHHHPGSQHMSAKKKTKKWLINIDEVDEAIDEAMEKILKRDGRKIYREASSDLLTFYTNTIVHMDGRTEAVARHAATAGGDAHEREKIYEDSRRTQRGRQPAVRLALRRNVAAFSVPARGDCGSDILTLVGLN